MNRVLCRVVEHPLRQRSHGPIGALVLLVQLHSKKTLEQRGETERLEPEQLRRDTCVEDVTNVPAVILMEQTEIVIRVVKDDFDVAVLEQRAESGGVTDG